VANQLAPAPTAWGIEPRGAAPSRGVVAICLGLAAVLAGVGAVAWAAGGPGAGAAAVVALGAGLWVWVALQPRRLTAGARPLDAPAAPRLANIVAGLSTDLGIPTPSLFLLREEGANAYVCRSGGPRLGVTPEVLEGYTRTELEALVAHCLLRLGRSNLRRESLVAALGPLGRPLCPLVGPPEDVAAASVTRYPPALASAIRKASPAPPRAPFSFVAAAPFHEAPEARAALLADL
jgi:hypothetical protein